MENFEVNNSKNMIEVYTQTILHVLNTVLLKTDINTVKEIKREQIEKLRLFP